MKALMLASLVVGSALTPSPSDEAAYVRARDSLTACIVRQVVLGQYTTKPQPVSKRIEDAVYGRCLPQVIDMMSAYDAVQGEGGRNYFLGTYLDKVVPEAIKKSLEAKKTKQAL